MKITIVYDNTTTNDELIADWGFACIIDYKGRRILFDTGGNGKILLENLMNLSIDPSSFDDIVISHPDFDHIGGLSHILNLNQTAVIHNPISFRGIKYPNKVIHYDVPTKIYENIFTTGELGNREQSLGIKTEKGIVLVIGCSHPGLGEIISTMEEFGEIYMIVGGLHGFNKYEVIENIDKICATHCTKNIEPIKNLYPQKIISGGVGKIIIV